MISVISVVLGCVVTAQINGPCILYKAISPSYLLSYHTRNGGFCGPQPEQTSAIVRSESGLSAGANTIT
jgi:hypothetical protein